MASQKLHYTALLAISLIIFVILISSVSARTGTATYYTPPYRPSSCYGNKDEGVMIAAASDAFYEGGKACGHKYKVTCLSAAATNSNPCSGGSVVVKIVDYCPSCRGTIDLSQDAFASIADLDAGVINVSFQKV